MANPTLDARPRLVKGGSESREVEPARRAGVTPGLLWVLAGLLAFTVGAAVLQTERLDRMTGRAAQLAARSEALQADLTNAQAQIRAFEQERERVRESVADLARRVAALYAVVQPDGAPMPAPPAEPAR